jgi:hypothetical protein
MQPVVAVPDVRLAGRVGVRVKTRPLHPAGSPAKHDPFFEDTAR